MATKTVGLIFDLAVNQESKKQLDSLEAALMQNKNALAENRKEIREFKKELAKAVEDKDTKQIEELTKKIKENEQANVSLIAEQRALRKERQLVNKEVNQQIKNFQDEKKAIEAPKDSLVGLRLEYARLRKEIDITSKTDPDFGRLTAQARLVKQDIDLIGKSVGDFRSQVGNYRKGATELIDIVTGGLVTGGVTAIVQRGVEIVREAAMVITEFERNLDELSSITGLRGDDLDRLGQKAIKLSTEFGTAASDILVAYQKIGSAQPELLENADALAEVTRQAEILAKAGKITLPEAGEILAKSLNQSGEDYRSAAKFADILATSQQRGTATIQQLSDAYKNVGSVIKASNLSFEEGNVLLQALAKGGLTGAEAGTQLRGILLRLAATNRDELNPSTQSLNDILDILAKEVTNVSQAQKIFGAENAAAALTLIDQRDIVRELNGELNDQGNALSQARTNTDNLQGAYKELTAQYNAFILSLEDGDGILSRASKGIISSFSDVIESIRLLNEGSISLGSFIPGQLGFGLAQARLNELREDALVKRAERAEEAKNAFSNRSKSLLEELGLVDEAAEDGFKKVEESAKKAAKSYDELREEQSNLKDEILDAKVKGEPYADLLSRYNKVTKQLDGANKLFAKTTKATGKVIEEVAKGSIIDLTNQISKLKKDIESSNNENEIAKKVEELVAKEKQVESLKENIEATRLLLNQVRVETPQELLSDDELKERELPVLNRTVRRLEEGGVNIDDELERLERRKQVELRDAAEIATTKEEFAKQQAAIELDFQKQILEAKLKDSKLSFDERVALERQLAEVQLEEAKKTSDVIKALQSEVFQGILDIGQKVAGSFFDVRREKIEQEKDTEIEALEQTYEKRIENAEGNQQLQERLEAELEQKREEAQKRAAIRKQQIARKEALIEGAVSFIEAIPNPVLMAAAIIGTAAQIAVIDAQKFNQGGFVTGPGTSTSDSIPAMLSNGEFVVKASSVRALGLDFMNRINNLEGFVNGGLIGNNVPQITRPALSPTSVNSNVSFSNEQANYIAEVIAVETSKQVANAVEKAINTSNERERQRKINELRLTK